MAEVVVLISRLKEGTGGVASYFRCLQGELSGAARYLSIGGMFKGEKPLLKPLRLVRDVLALIRSMSAVEVGVVHLNPSMLWKALIREGLHLLCARVACKRVLVFWHGWDWGVSGRLGQGLYGTLFRKVYGLADCHIVLADEFRVCLRQCGITAPIICESTVVSDSMFRDPDPSPRQTARARSMEPVRLLFLSRLEKQKGIYAAIDATAQLIAAGYRVQLAVAGNGAEKQAAERYVAERGIPGVSFTGYLRGDAKDALIRDSDIYLFPSSHGEGMPLSVLEAMAAGLPVICTRAGGLDNFFQDGCMGYSTAEPTADNVAALVKQLLASPDRVRAMGQFNRDYAGRHFRASVVARRVLRIYGYLLATSTAKAPGAAGAATRATSTDGANHADQPDRQIPPDWMDAAGAEGEVDEVLKCQA